MDLNGYKAAAIYREYVKQKPHRDFHLTLLFNTVSPFIPLFVIVRSLIPFEKIRFSSPWCLRSC